MKKGAEKTSAQAASASYDVLAATRVEGTDKLPRAPASAFRKRPVRLDYDKNEFH